MGYEATRHYTDPFTAFGQSFLNVGAQAMTGTGQLFYAPVSIVIVTLAKASASRTEQPLLGCSKG